MKYGKDNIVPVTAPPASEASRALRHFEVRLLNAIEVAARRADTAEVLRLTAKLRAGQKLAAIGAELGYA